MKNQVGSSRLDTVLKVLLIAFISLLAFSSGVFFGKQMSDSDYQLKALEGDFSKTEKVAGHEKKNGEGSEEALIDEEVASLTDKYVNAEHEKTADGTAEENAVDTEKGKAGETRKVASAEAEEASGIHGATKNTGHGPAVAQTKPSNKAEHKDDLSAAHAAANRIANNHAPTEPIKPQAETGRVPSSLPKTVGAANEIEFTVQVASYPTAEAAKEHAVELTKKGFPAFPVEAAIGGRTWYRVSVGSFKTMKEATVYRAQLLKQADVPSAIVQRIQR